MSNIAGTNLAAPIVPFTTDDNYATHSAEYGKGGWHSVKTISDRDNIPAQRRETGMVVFVQADDTPYRLKADDSWERLFPDVDDSLSSTSKNPVQNLVVKEAIDNINTSLSGKQNGNDNNLSTTDKNIVGAINELYSRILQIPDPPSIEFCISVTWSQLKTLRDNGQLVAGVWHRIIDYTTTVANDSEAQSAGHPFDVLVMAIDNNRLLEDAFATHSARDTDGYFDNSKLSAWKIGYCLDNDTSRFMWADTENGKGVIYRMADEWYNCAPYDFKNIQFKRYLVTDTNEGGDKDTGLSGQYIGTNAEMMGLSVEDYEDYVWCYTFSFGERTAMPSDASLIGFNSDELGEGYGYKGYYGANIIKPCSCYQSIDDEQHSVFCLNNVIWFTNNTKYRASVSNTLVDDECINMTLSGNGTHIGYDTQNIIMGDGCYNINIEGGCFLITFGQYCYNIQFGQGCNWITFGQGCGEITFGQGCNWITFGQNVRYSVIEADVKYVNVPNEAADSYVQNIHIFNGVRGKDGSNKINLDISPNQSYTQFVALKSDGTVRIWNPADV